MKVQWVTLISYTIVETQAYTLQINVIMIDIPVGSICTFVTCIGNTTKCWHWLHMEETYPYA